MLSDIISITNIHASLYKSERTMRSLLRIRLEEMGSSERHGGISKSGTLSQREKVIRALHLIMFNKVFIMQGIPFDTMGPIFNDFDSAANKLTKNIKPFMASLGGLKSFSLKTTFRSY